MTGGLAKKFSPASHVDGPTFALKCLGYFYRKLVVGVLVWKFGVSSESKEETDHHSFHLVGPPHSKDMTYHSIPM